MKERINNFVSKYLVLFALIGFDSIVILLHLLFSENLALFNLDIEHNVPTIYQFLKLNFIFIFLLISSYILKQKKKNIYWFFLLLGIGFLLLASDELGQIHENASTFVSQLFPQYSENYENFVENSHYNSSEWLILYIPIFIIAFNFFVFFVYKFRLQLQEYMQWFVLGIIFFAFVPIVELINTSQEYFFLDGYENLVLVEEALEILGATFFLYFAYNILKKELRTLKLTFSSYEDA